MSRLQRSFEDLRGDTEMKSMRLTEKQRENLMKFWKIGRFRLYSIRLKDKSKILKEWQRLGIIEKLSPVDYKINREEFVKLDGNKGQRTLKESIKNQQKQVKQVPCGVVHTTSKLKAFPDNADTCLGECEK